jgi:hypothetical protein
MSGHGRVGEARASAADSSGVSAVFTRRLGPLAALAVALLCLAPAAIPLAAVTRTAADAALARASAAAVRGVVIAVTTRRDPAVDTLYTHVQLAVTRAWGFPASPSSITLKLLGGADAGRALVVGGQARFAVGEDVLVFLDVRPRDGTLSVTGLERGKWTMDGGGAAVASRTRHDAPAAIALDVVPARDPNPWRLAGTTGWLPATTLAAPAAFGSPSRQRPQTSFLRRRRAGTGRLGRARVQDSMTGSHPLFPGSGFTQLLRAIDSLDRPRRAAAAARHAARTAVFRHAEGADGRV